MNTNQIKQTIHALTSQLINKRPMTDRLRKFVDTSLMELEKHEIKQNKLK